MLLYVTRKFPPSVGGMERFNFKLYHRTRMLRPFKFVCWGGNNWGLPYFLVIAFIKSFVYCVSGKISVIYVSDGLLSPFALLFKTLFRIPAVVTIHGRDIAFSLWIYQFVVPRALKRVDKVICVSNHLKDECLKRGVPESIIRVIPNGVDFDDFHVPEAQTQFHKIEDLAGRPLLERPRILTVGRLVPKKGIDSFIRNILPLVVEQIPDVLYLVAGDGPDYAKITELVAQQGLQDNVCLLGRIEMKSGLLSVAYQMADVFVMPNVPVKDDTEGFGIVAIEACIAGIPVVATNVDGISQAIIDGKNGFLFAYGNYVGFAEKIVELLNDKQARLAAGAQGREFTHLNYSWETIARYYHEIFNELCGIKDQ